MMFGERARYMKGGNTLTARGHSRIARLTSLITAGLAVLIVAMTVLGTFGSTLAYADSTDDQNTAQSTIEKLSKGYPVNGKDGKVDLDATLEKANSEDGSNKNTFGYVLKRMMFIHYMNEGSKGNNCNVNNAHAGTVIYHNCDVPNMMTEIAQDLMSMFVQTGSEGADVTSAKMDIPQFGLPTNIPGGGAPVKASDRSAKYTGLELYGYNLKFTNYNGEFDHIKVMTSARMMTNFGLMDGIKLGTSTVLGGIAGGLTASTTNFANNISQGDIIGAVGGFFSGAFSGSVTGGANAIMNASDQNVFDTYGWYRVGYGNTLYGARELTQNEVAANMMKKFYEYINKSQPKDANVPSDLAAIKGGLPSPKEAIAKCEIMDASGKKVKYGQSSTPPGVTKADCVRQADQAAAAHRENLKNDSNPKNDNDKVKAWYQWTKDGAQKSETLKQWKKNNKSVLDTASKYKMKVDIPTDESKRASTIASVKSSWGSKWSAAVKSTLLSKQDENNTSWVKKLLEKNALKKFMSKPENNFNAPWNRFVCENSNGTDKIDSKGDLVMLFDSKGNHNSACAQVRPPVQNGFFGNGYSSSPPVDTRYAALDTSVVGTLIPINSIATKIANFGLSIASVATRISNTAMNLSFSPILSTLGVNKAVVKVITVLRESIFFPLIVLFVGIAGVMALWSAGKNKDYGRQAVSLLLMTLTVMSGTFVMAQPQKMIDLVDGVPANIEQTIVGVVFSTGNTADDQLCTASKTSSGTASTDLNGNTIPYSAQNGTRSLLCENWRTFAFNPYVFGQWGTNFSNLYASGSGAPNTMKNTNGSLVGNAGVVMGGGATMKNWGLYQLSTTSSGTASYADNSVKSQTNNNFYRMVDLQAGPNNGAGTDQRYFQQWSGDDPVARLTVGTVGAAVSVVGMITVVVYSFSKIIISFLTVVMLMIMPIMFLFGILPNQGRMKLKGYFGTLIGLVLQRIVLVLLLAVMFRVLVSIGTMSTNYLLLSLMSVVVCIAFLLYRKQILDLVFSGISSKMGTPVGEEFIRNPKDWAAQQGVRTPGAFQNWMSQGRTAVSSVGTGAIAGFISGGVSGAGKAAKENWKINQDRLKNQQRRAGYGILQTSIEAGRAGKAAAQDKLDKDLYASNVKREIFMKSDAYKTYQEAHKLWEGFDKHEKVDGVNYAVDPTTGDYLPEPKKPVMSDVLSMNARASRRLAEAAKTSRVLERRGTAQYDKEYRREINGNRTDVDDADSSPTASKNGAEYARDAERYSRNFNNDSRKTARAKDEARRDKLADQVESAANYNKNFDDPDLRDSLDNLRRHVNNFEMEQKRVDTENRHQQQDSYFESHQDEYRALDENAVPDRDVDRLNNPDQDIHREYTVDDIPVDEEELPPDDKRWR